MFALLMALSASAPAQPRDEARILRGDDIAAWELVQATDDPEQLQQFLTEFPSSPLAELAYRRLSELDPETAENTRLAQSVANHDVELERTGQTAVATLSLRPDPIVVEPTPPTLSPQLELGAMAWSTGPGLYVGAGLGRQHLSGWMRAQGAPERLDLSAAVRLSMRPESLSPYVEGVAAWMPLEQSFGVGGALGVTQPLAQGFGLSLAGEVLTMGGPPGLTLRFGLLKTF